MFFVFFFTDPATTEIYTLSLHDALPISLSVRPRPAASEFATIHPEGLLPRPHRVGRGSNPSGDRKSTRLNSSHPSISYAVFCLKKKKNKNQTQIYILLSKTQPPNHQYVY